MGVDGKRFEGMTEDESKLEKRKKGRGKERRVISKSQRRREAMRSNNPRNQ